MILLGQLFNCLPGSPKILLADVEQFLIARIFQPFDLERAAQDESRTRRQELQNLRRSAWRDHWCLDPDGSSKLTHVLIGVGEFAGRTRGYSAQFLQTINPSFETRPQPL
jgi:hypothetical protein